MPVRGWHVDANYTSQLWPPKGVQTHALFGDIAPRSGATQILSGSHRLIHKWFKDNPPPAGARSAEMRRSLRMHPYIRDLHTEGDRDQPRHCNRSRSIGQFQPAETVSLQTYLAGERCLRDEGIRFLTSLAELLSRGPVWVEMVRQETKP